MIDAELLSSLIGTVYDAALDPTEWPSILERLSELLGGGYTGLLCVGGGSGFSGVQPASGRLDPAAIALYEAHYIGLDYIAAAAAGLPTGVLLLDREVLSREAQARTDFYAEWAHPNDLGGCATAVLCRRRASSTILIAAHRRKVDGFQREQHDLLTLLLPHLGRAALLAARLHAAEDERDAAADALDALADPVLLVGAEGRLVRTNRAAERLLARRDGLSAGRHGELRAASAAGSRALGHLLAQAARPDAAVRTGGTLSLERPSLAAPLRLLAVPLPAAPVRPGLPPKARVFLVVVDPDEPRALPASSLRALFGLTPAEAAIALARAAGEGLPTVAERLGIARPTARTHTDRILAKTGTGRQAELARLLERLAVLC